MARFLSLVGPLGLLLSTIAGAVMLDGDGRVQMPFHILRLLFGLMVLVVFVDGRSQATAVGEKYDQLFDERERVERDRAFRLSHGIVAASISIAGLYGSIALGWGLWLPDVRNIIDLLIFGGFIAAVLPGTILIWLERPLDDG